MGGRQTHLQCNNEMWKVFRKIAKGVLVKRIKEGNFVFVTCYAPKM